MPAAQILDFGPDPFAESISKFAQGFSSQFIKDQTRKDNEEIFKRIKMAYENDADPTRMYKDLLSAEGMDEDYKTDKLKQVKDYLSVVGKKDLTPYQKQLLDVRKGELKIKGDNAKNKETQLANAKLRIENTKDKNNKDFPTKVSNYVNSILKDTGSSMSAQDKAEFNSRIVSNMQDTNLSINDALSEALQYQELKQEIRGSKITPKPSTNPIWGEGKDGLDKSLKTAYNEIEQIYDAGLTSQKDLRKILENSGWKEEAQAILQDLFKTKGKKIRTPKQTENPKLQEATNILFG